MSSPPIGRQNDSPRTINPYAPTIAPVQRPVLPSPVVREVLSNIKVLFSTIGCVAAAGGIFGFGFVLVISLVDNDPSALTFAMISVPVGTVWALVAAVVVVPIALFASCGLRDQDRPWAAGEIYFFGAICGFATGFCCVAVPIVSQPDDAADLLVALVPAVVGGIATPLMLIPLARRAQPWSQPVTVADETSELAESPNVFGH